MVPCTWVSPPNSILISDVTIVDFPLDSILIQIFYKQFHFDCLPQYSVLKIYKLLCTQHLGFVEINSSTLGVIGLVGSVKPILWPPVPIAGPSRAIWYRIESRLLQKIAISIPFDFPKNHDIDLDLIITSLILISSAVFAQLTCVPNRQIHRPRYMQHL